MHSFTLQMSAFTMACHIHRARNGISAVTRRVYVKTPSQASTDVPTGRSNIKWYP